MNRFQPLAILFCCIFSFLGSACEKESIIPGHVAMVNEEPIAFRELESRRAALFSGVSPKLSGLDDDVLYKQYRYTLGQIIEEEVIFQYMTAQGLAPSRADIDKEEAVIRNDYPEGSFDEMLIEQAVTLDLWRKGIARRLAIERFVTEVLRPEISISPEEFQQYYHAHRSEFIVPEQWDFLQITGPDQKEVDAAKTHLIKEKDAEASQKEFLVSIHDISINPALLPKDMKDMLTPLKPWQGAKTRKVEKDFQTVILVEKMPSKDLDAAEISKRVEQALLEEKTSSTYTNWITKRLPKNRITVTPFLSSPPQKGKNTQQPASGNPSSQAPSPQTAGKSPVDPS